MNCMHNIHQHESQQHVIGDTPFLPPETRVEQKVRIADENITGLCFDEFTIPT